MSRRWNELASRAVIGSAFRRARFGSFEVDSRAGEVRREGRKLRLQGKPFQVLLALLEHPQDVVLREELRARLWPGDTFVDFDNNLNTAVSKLREVLGDSAEAPRLIETLSKRGYRLLVPVEWIGANGAAGAPGARRRWRLAAAALAVAAVVAGLWALARSSTSPAPGSTDDSPGREGFLKGRYLAAKGSTADLRQAIAYFQRAVEDDPQYAPAYAALAKAYATLPVDPAEAMPLAREAAVRAVAADPSLAEAHLRLALVRLYYDWDWEGARMEFERALELGADDVDVHHAYAGYLSLMGDHDGARASMARAIELDPVSVAVAADAGWYHYVARRFDDAVAQSRRALELEPGHRGAHYYMLLAFLAQDRQAEAREAAAAYVRLEGSDAEVVLAGGLPGFWRWKLERLEENARREFVPAGELALHHAALGDRERALDFLESAFAEHSGWVLPFLRVYPALDPLRAEPRFRALERRMSFPAPAARAARSR